MSRLRERLREWADRPTDEFVSRFNTRWEYEQANAAVDWEREPDLDALRTALSDYRARTDGAFEHLLSLAAGGSLVAMTKVGEGYLWGDGVHADAVEAEVWLRKAYELGSRRGLLSYGRAISFRKDWPAAEKVFGVGASAGWPEAMAQLVGVVLKQEPSTTIPSRVLPLLESAAAAGHPWANRRLAWALARGHFGPARILEGLQIWWRQIREVRSLWEARDFGASRTDETLH